MSLTLFADQKGIPKLYNDSINVIIQRRVIASRSLLDQARTVWDNTPESSNLRTLFLHILLDSEDLEEYLHINVKEIPMIS